MPGKPKMLFALFCFLLLALWLPAQEPNLDVVRGFDRNTLDMPANEVIGLIIQSDNLVRKGRYEDAIMLLDRAVAEHPQFADAYLKRGIVLYRTGRETEAQADFRRASQLNPYLIDLYGINGSEGRSKLLAFDPHDWLPQYELPETVTFYYDWLFHEFARCLEPEQAGPWCSLQEEISQTLGYLAKNDLDSAAFFLESLPNLDESAALMDLMGVIAFEREDLNQALNYHLNAEAKEEAPPMVFFNLSRTYLAMGRPDEALEIIETGLRLHPEFGPAYKKRALLHSFLGNSEQAISDYQKLDQLGTFGSEQIAISQAVNKKLNGELSTALQELNQIMDKQSTPDANLHCLRGNILFILGEAAQAQLDYSKALQWGDPKPEIYFNRGLSHLLQNSRANGCFDLQKAVDGGFTEGAQVLQKFCSY